MASISSHQKIVAFYQENFFLGIGIERGKSGLDWIENPKFLSSSSSSASSSSSSSSSSLACR